MSTGIDLILSTLCNATFCMASNYTTDTDTIWNFEEESLFIKKSRGIENHYSLKTLAKEINGKHLKIATYINEPMSCAKPDSKGKLTGCGVAFFVVNILRDKFNFTYEVVLPKKNLIMGGTDPENSLIGLVNTEKVDMAAAFVSDLQEFRELVDFSVQLEEESWVMILKRPSESAVGEGLLAPFNDFVWYLILAAVVTFGPCIYIFTRVRAKLVSDEEPPLSLYRIVWFVYGTLIKQGTNLNPRDNTTRVLFTTWWLFVMLLSAFYLANLTAFLTLSEFTLEVKGPQDLLKKNYPWLAAEGGVIEYAVTKPTGNMYYLNEMVKRKRGLFQRYTSINDFFKQVNKGVVLIKSSATATHGLYQSYVEKTKRGIPEKQRCPFVVARTPFTKNMRGFIYPKNSKLKILFDGVLQRIIESGIVMKLKNLRIPNVRICPMDLQMKERKLQTTDLVMTYHIAVTGGCAAIAVFAGEIIFWKYLRAKSVQRIKDKKTKKTKCPKNSVFYNSQTDAADSPPSYDDIFGTVSQIPTTGAFKKVINGREYLVVDSQGGVRLIPTRTPSALLYRLGKK